MDKVRIYSILDFILNQADADDLAAIREALKRRSEQRGFGGVDITNVARETSQSIEDQVGGSLDSIRQMIRNFAVEMIKKEAPEIPAEHLEKLIQAWIPVPGAADGTPDSAGELPRDALLEMIRQFVAAGTGTIDQEEDAALKKEFGDWEELYWNRFPTTVRKTIRKYLKNEIDEGMFRELINRILPG